MIFFALQFSIFSNQPYTNSHLSKSLSVIIDDRQFTTRAGRLILVPAWLYLFLVTALDRWFRLHRTSCGSKPGPDKLGHVGRVRYFDYLLLVRLERPTNPARAMETVIARI